MSKVSGKLCIKFEVDTKKLEKRHVSYTTFLYNIAKAVLVDWDEYYEGIHLSIGEDDYVEVGLMPKYIVKSTFNYIQKS